MFRDFPLPVTRAGTWLHTCFHRLRRLPMKGMSFQSIRITPFLPRCSGRHNRGIIILCWLLHVIHHRRGGIRRLCVLRASPGVDCMSGATARYGENRIAPTIALRALPHIVIGLRVACAYRQSETHRYPSPITAPVMHVHDAQLPESVYWPCQWRDRQQHLERAGCLRTTIIKDFILRLRRNTA